MAAAKRKPRTRSRATKRRPARKNGNASFSSLLALCTIVTIGALSIWAVSQDKSPQAAISSLFNSSSISKIMGAPAIQSPNHADKEPARSVSAGIINQNKEPNTRATAIAPVPRPEIGLSSTKVAGLQAPQPPSRPDNTTNVVPVAKPNQMVSTATPPATVTKNLPPRGINNPDTTPIMVYAKKKLTVHKTAWNKSPSMGEVEKGRELRSYGQTGKWHRVVVPATDMIGWVHQDMLVIVKKSGQQSAQSPAMITTGSLKAATARPHSFPAKSTNNHPIPKNNVGN